MRDLFEDGRDLHIAVSRLREAGGGFVIVKAQRVLAESRDHGLGYLLEAAERLRADGVSGAALADSILGRAALLVAVWAGVRACHGETVSDDALREAQQHGLFCSHGRRVSTILNRSKSGPCPFEAATRGVTDPGDAVRILRSVAAGMAGGPTASARWIAAAGVGVALAVMLPVGFHAVGLGSTMLPMHLPVLITAALFGAKAGGLVGALSPVLSHLLLGMPPMVPPIAPLMTLELAAYGLVAGAVRGALLRRVGRAMGSRGRALALEYAWLVAAMLAGRLTLGLAAAWIGPLLGLSVPAVAYVTGAVLTGIPGMIVQLLVVPAVVMRLSRWMERRVTPSPLPASWLGRRELS